MQDRAEGKLFKAHLHPCISSRQRYSDHTDPVVQTWRWSGLQSKGHNNKCVNAPQDHFFSMFIMFVCCVGSLTECQGGKCWPGLKAVLGLSRRDFIPLSGYNVCQEKFGSI